MNERPQKRPHRNQMDKANGLRNIGMGVIYIAVGIFVIFGQQKKLMHLGGQITAYIIAGIVIIYGLFRLWRGWQLRKNA